MKFDDLDERMRVYETAHDLCVLPGLFMVARIDGRGFTRLTKEILSLEAPFDASFRDHMLATTEHLMDCGFQVLFAYSQSDEISLVLDRDENAFGRKLRKLNSVLAGEASAKLSLRLGTLAAFDCRISQLPSVAILVDYLRWRSEDAHRNALSAHCYWALRKLGRSARQATHEVDGLSTAAKIELLGAQGGIDFDRLPGWQTRGSGLYWEEYQKPAVNALTGEAVLASRRRIKRNLELPAGEAFGVFLREILAEPGPGGERG
jgi:tRNA(His) 5'-end guanylyltransferase